MADDHRIAVSAKCFVKNRGIAGKRGDVVLAISGDRRGRVTPHERSDSPVSGISKGGQEVAPAVRRIGKPMEAKGKWAGIAGRGTLMESICMMRR